MAVGKKTGGKVIGSKNLKTKVTQAFWQSILDKEQNNIKLALSKTYAINPLEYLKVLISITEFVMPKLARVDGTVEEANKTRVIRKKADD